MTLSELKLHTSALLKARREVALPDNDVLIPLIYEAMINIANRYTVLNLVVKSENFRVLRAIDDGYYIRMPKEPRAETEQIDLDRELHIAVSNYVASAIASETKNIIIFKRTADRIVKDYSFKLYKTKVYS